MSASLPDIEPTLAATDPVEMDKYNQLLIAEFRANAGTISGQLAGAPVLLLNTVGAKSGRPRTTPLAYVRDGDRYIVMASKAGASTNPAWYHNLVATSRPTVEVGDTSFEVRVTVAQGQERTRLFNQIAAQWPMAHDYQRSTTRQIPVMILQPLGP